MQRGMHCKNSNNIQHAADSRDPPEAVLKRRPCTLGKQCISGMMYTPASVDELDNPIDQAAHEERARAEIQSKRAKYPSLYVRPSDGMDGMTMANS